MIFQTRSDTVRLVTSSAATLDVLLVVNDTSSGKLRLTHKISSATTTVISTAPIATRDVEHITIYNSHASTSDNLILQLYDGTNSYVVYQCTLPAKYTLIYNESGATILTDDGTAIGGVDGGAP